MLILMMSLMIATVSYAAQVETECAAMNESREKVIKTVKTKTKASKGSSSTRQ